MSHVPGHALNVLPALAFSSTNAVSGTQPSVQFLAQTSSGGQKYFPRTAQTISEFLALFISSHWPACLSRVSCRIVSKRPFAFASHSSLEVERAR